MEHEGSLQPLQEPTTCPYPEPDQSRPYSHIPLPKDLKRNTNISLNNINISFVTMEENFFLS
jgi:hypothetical protein